MMFPKNLFGNVIVFNVSEPTIQLSNKDHIDLILTDIF